ncbi:peptide deformylase [Garciella nitratireducens]|uniref:peptide deformylase n=1 Tax=Garciella nitratireducens TaxID=218205 RepID=UPI000DE9CB8E|nr:peptide deformylase [Garciella nitratireducens]RBP39177.1 peptide deformylase [Garciella nitratireducens]
MAIRNIRQEGDPILRKKCRKIERINERIRILAKDMLDTMYEAEGVGLAAPQVGILKRLIVIDVGEGPITLVNPEVVSEEGEQEDLEGCLSIPGRSEIVIRPKRVIVKGLDLEENQIEVKGEDFLARALCHEIDHLEGILYIDKAINKKESR